MEEGNLLWIDTGCKVNGYSSDFSRIAAIGEPSSEQKNMYDIVNGISNTAVAAIRPGIKASDLSQLCNQEFEKAELFSGGSIARWEQAEQPQRSSAPYRLRPRKQAPENAFACECLDLSMGMASHYLFLVIHPPSVRTIFGNDHAAEAHTGTNGINATTYTRARTELMDRKMSCRG